jgi:hypothetical protein
MATNRFYENTETLFYRGSTAMSETLEATQLGLFQFLRIIDESFDPAKCKVHLASANSLKEEPINEYLAGRFESWQSRQNNKNFNRDYVISLIKLPAEENRWLFGGIHQVHGFKEDQPYEDQPNTCYLYSTTRCDQFDMFSGHIIVSFSRPGRQSYLCAENHDDGFTLAEFLPEGYQK